MAERGARLGLVILAVEDVPRARSFYRAAFGWEPLVEVPVYTELGLSGGMRLGLYERRAFGANTGRAPVATPPGELAPTELYFYPGDLEATAVRLVAAGARLLSPLARRAWGDEAAYYADLDGNVVVIARAG